MTKPPYLTGRTWYTLVLLILLWVLGAGMLNILVYAQNMPRVEKSPAPDWVRVYDPIDPGEIPSDEIQDGRYYLHVDRQVKVGEGAPVEYYHHYRIYLVNESGLEKASQINISFDPSYQRLELNQLQAIRSEEVISKLEDAQVQLLRREAHLESMMYDGRFTANIIVKDVRVGDILEYAYTVVGENPIYDDIFSDWLNVSWRVPVKKLDYILHWPRQRPFFQISHKTTLALDREEAGEEILFTLSRQDVPGYRGNSETPAWHRSYGVIQMSQLQNWSEVVDWARPLYAVAYEDHPAVTALARSLGSRLDTDAQRLLAVLTYLQKEVRYLGIEMGVNSHRPSPPQETLERRYGDCKDKTVAMVALLHAMGIEAQPALVNTDGIRNPSDFHPAIDAFDHVIVRVTLPSATYWLDPTRGYQGQDLQDIFQPDYGFVLVVAPGQTDLTRMPANTHLVGYRIEESFELPREMDKAVAFTITSTYHGLDAENQRRQVAEDGISEIQSRYLDYYRKYYAGIKIRKPVQVLDDEARNTLQIKEQYWVDDFWEKDDENAEWYAAFYTGVIESYLRRPKQRQRSEPFWISHPENIEQRIRVQLPEAWDIETFDFKEDNAHFQFAAKAEYDADAPALYLSYHYRSLQDTVDSQDIAGYLEAVDRVEDKMDYYLYKPYTKTETTSPVDLGSRWWADNGLLLIIALAAVGLAYVIVEWIIDLRKLQLDSPVAFYPVSLLKFTVLCLATLGIYQIYWFYKQWSFIRARDDSAIMPAARAIFLPFWFFAFYRDLRKDSLSRFGRSNLPAASLIVLLLIIYVSLYFAGRLHGMAQWVGVLDFLCLLPFVNYIQFINRHEAGALTANSRFRPRHLILSAFALVLLVYGLAISLHWMPSNEVIRGNQLSAGSIRFMQHQGLIKDGSDLLYFYSDAFWSNRDDGNGVTLDRVFSYWRDDDNGRLVVRSARYADIASVNLKGVQAGSATAVIAITPKSGLDFLLYASTQNGMHRAMVQEIEARLASSRDSNRTADADSRQ